MNAHRGFQGVACGSFLLMVGCMDGGMDHGSMDGMDHSMGHFAPAPVVVEGAFTEVLGRIPVVEGTSATLEPQAVRSKPDAGSLDALGYSSAGPLGPTLSLRTGDRIGVTLRNKLSEATNLHWHGLTAPADLDGHPDSGTAPGASKTYSFPISNRAGMYWYHPHFMGSTARQAYRGLAGLIRVTDAQEEALKLPGGLDEIPLVLQDKRVSAGSLVYAPTSSDVMSGWMGETITVNGVASPVLKVRKGWVRLRILNGSNARIFQLALDDQREMRLVGSDGGLLGQSAGIRSQLMGPGERTDLLVDFSKDTTGTVHHLHSLAFANGGVQGRQSFRVLKIVVDSSVGTTTAMPTDLGPISLPDPSKAARTRVFTLDGMGAMGGTTGMSGMTGMTGMHTINGKTWDPRRIDETVVAGQTEIWEFKNTTDEPHPVHVHGLQFSVVARWGGRIAPEPFEKGWKDSFLLLPGETARIALVFPDNPGDFLLHCHNLEHEEDGMMLRFRIQSAGGV